MRTCYVGINPLRIDEQACGMVEIMGPTNDGGWMRPLTIHIEEYIFNLAGVRHFSALFRLQQRNVTLLDYQDARRATWISSS